MVSRERPIDDPIGAAMHLLADAGYVVLRAPSCPRDLLAAVVASTAPTPTPRPAAQSDGSERHSLMTVKEFCRRYALGKSTVYTEIKAGRLKIQKIGHSTRISVEAASDWLRRWNPTS